MVPAGDQHVGRLVQRQPFQGVSESAPLRAQLAIDRFMNNTSDFVIEGESYRRRQKPTLDTRGLTRDTGGTDADTMPQSLTRHAGGPPLGGDGS